MTVAIDTLPRWDMTPVFAGLDSPAFNAEFDVVIEGVSALQALYDTVGVRRLDDAVSAPDAVDEVLEATNELLERLRTVQSYVHAFVTTDARHDLAQARQSELRATSAEVSKLTTRLEAWLGSMDADALVAGSGAAAAHAFFVRRCGLAAKHQMSEAEEDLAASLGPSGTGAWTKLHGDVGSRLRVPLERPDGTTEVLPVSAIRALAHKPDRDLRAAAYRAEIAAWETVEVPMAAAMNSIKGWANTVNARRGWPDAVEPALFANNVDRETLEAMQDACVAAFPDLRRYLKVKARLLGVERLPWWDIYAPVGGEAKEWTWDQTHAFVVERFGTYSDGLAALADRAFRERWIDAEPRDGKRDGGFCMGVRGDESRILVNFNRSFMGVSTIAHELGHAYHNTCLADRTPLQRRTPMALAETASTFCETIVQNAMLADAAPAERLAILNGDLERGTLIVVDIHSRFLFEKAVFDRRRRRELSAAELKEEMIGAQLAAYGDALDPEHLHPYAWANKPHYYSTHFYNWPYTFGQLFGLGLYARYGQDPDGFRAGYDDMLGSTGSEDAATLARRFDIDVRSADFWASSLAVVVDQIEEFDRLAP